jgi:hypothetical protein
LEEGYLDTIALKGGIEPKLAYPERPKDSGKSISVILIRVA